MFFHCFASRSAFFFSQSQKPLRLLFSLSSTIDLFVSRRITTLQKPPSKLPCSTLRRRQGRGFGPCVFQMAARGAAPLEICKHRRARVHLNVRLAPPCSAPPAPEITHDTHSTLPCLTSCASPPPPPPGTGPSQTISSQYLHEACETLDVYGPPFC